MNEKRGFKSRNNNWVKKKKNHLKKIQKLQKQIQMKECTFQPKIYRKRYNKCYSNKNKVSKNNKKLKKVKISRRNIQRPIKRKKKSQQNKEK